MNGTTETPGAVVDDPGEAVVEEPGVTTVVEPGEAVVDEPGVTTVDEPGVVATGAGAGLLVTVQLTRKPMALIRRAAISRCVLIKIGCFFMMLSI